MRIDSSGNVAIGNTSAGAKLDIRQDSGTAIRCEDGSGGYFVVQHGGSVGIGTSSPTFTTGSGLEIQRDGPATLRIEDTGSSGKPFEIYSDDAEGYVLSGIGSGMPMIFKTISTEAMRIDTSQNVLVGTTSTSTATQGIKLRSDLDAIAAVADGQVSGYFGRLNSDGDILNFRKDSTTVGSIGTNGGAFYISSPYGTDSGLKFASSIYCAINNYWSK